MPWCNDRVDMGNGHSARKQVRDGAVQQRAFFADVMDVVREVPRGRVTSYGAIARYLGAAQSAAPMRAVLFIAGR